MTTPPGMPNAPAGSFPPQGTPIPRPGAIPLPPFVTPPVAATSYGLSASCLAEGDDAKLLSRLSAAHASDDGTSWCWTDAASHADAPSHRSGPQEHRCLRWQNRKHRRGRNDQSSTLIASISRYDPSRAVQRLLEVCGEVKSWKRAEDPDTHQPKAFGFCEFEEAEGVLR